MAKVIVMQAPSGAGKSTYVEKLLAAHKGFRAVVSADHYFIGEDGVYRFDPSKLGEAHAQCLRRYVDCLRTPEEPGDNHLLIVDNTNTTVAELAPYCALALAHGYELEIIRLNVDWQTAAGRNTHGVPLVAVQTMAMRIAESTYSIPPFWPVTEVTP